MMKEDTVYLRHILDAIARIEEYTEGVDYEDFMDVNLVQAGVMREIEIIGEAAKRLSKNSGKNIPTYPGERWLG